MQKQRKECGLRRGGNLFAQNSDELTMQGTVTAVKISIILIPS